MKTDVRETRRYGDNSPLHNQVAFYDGHRSVRLLHENIGLATTAYSFSLGYDELIEAAERIALLWNLYLGVSTEDLRRRRRPAENLAATILCPCATFEQDENCPEGQPSLLCSACDGTGNAPTDKVIALASEMMKIAEQVDELEDPFAAWESVSLLQSQNDQLHKALADMVPPKLTWKERDADGFLVHHKVAAINAARAALSSREEGKKP